MKRTRSLTVIKKERRQMKKAVSLVLALVLCLTLGVWGSGKASAETANDQTAAIERNTLAAGWSHFAAVLEDGHVIIVGDGEETEGMDVSDWEDIVSVSAGWEFTVGLKSDGTVVGTGKSIHYSGVEQWTDIVDIACGAGFTVGLKKDGTVVATGDDIDGKEKEKLEVSDWTDIVNVATGFYHTIGLKKDGTVVATGWNEHGTCDVGKWTDIVDIAGTDIATIGLKSDGTVVYTGGFNSSERAKYYEPLKRWKDIVSIKAFGHAHVVGIKADGTIISNYSEPPEGASGLSVAFNWNCTTVYMLPDGTIECDNADVKEAFGDAKLMTPTMFNQTTEKTQDQSTEKPRITEQDTGVWALKAFTDGNGLPIDEYYICSQEDFYGAFGEDGSSDISMLKAGVIFFGDYDYTTVRVSLYEYGVFRVSNSGSKYRYYDITVEDAEGSKSYAQGIMFNDSEDVYFVDAESMVEALEKGGDVRVDITEDGGSSNTYSFIIDANGFSTVLSEFWDK